MREKNQVVPDEMLSKETLSQDRIRCKQVPEAVACPGIGKMLEGEMDAHLGMKRIPWPVITMATHAMASIRSGFRLNMGKQSSPFRVTVMANLSR